ncbi:hypothetical protein AN220_11340 [Streptomyces nanshensis]|nr:hypothetical protein AN220_11340 [Streptomyces nanshensis]
MESAAAAGAGWAVAGLFAAPLAGALAGGCAVLLAFLCVGLLVGAPELSHLSTAVKRRFPHVR